MDTISAPTDTISGIYELQHLSSLRLASGQPRSLILTALVSLLRSLLWCATIRKSARVASRRNVTRPIVVVLPFSSLLWFAGREAPGLFGFQFFPNLSFNRRIGGLAQTAQD